MKTLLGNLLIKKVLTKNFFKTFQITFYTIDNNY